MMPSNSGFSFPSRREFLQGLSAGAVGATLGSGLFHLSSGSARAQTTSGKRLGFALAGLGMLSTNQIDPALQKTKHCRLAGIITGTPAKAETWKAKYNVPEKNIYSYDTMHRLADNADIDVVYVVTPNALHAEHTVKAA